MIIKPRLLILFTVLGGSAFAQMGGGGSFGNTDPFGGSNTAAGSAATAGWHPWLSANGNYSKVLSQSQTFNSPPLSNASLNGGIGGFKQWNLKHLAGGYSAGAAYRPSVSTPNRKWSTNHNANLSYSQQLTQRLSVFVQQMAGISDGGYGFASGYGVNGIPGVSSSSGVGAGSAGNILFGDPAVNGLVDNEIFTSRTKYYMGTGGLTYLFSERLALSAGGGANTVRRSQGISGMNSVTANSSLNYRVSRQSIVGGSGQFTRANYLNLFGGVQARQYSGSYSYQFNPTTEISAYAGGAQLLSNFVGSVPLPPELAAILGIGASLQVAQTNTWAPAYGLSFTKSFEQGGMSLTADRGLSMGNGVVLAGIREMISLGFNRTLSKKTALSIALGGVRQLGRIGVGRRTETLQGSMSFSYRVGGGFGLSSQAGVRYVGVPAYSHRSDVFVGGGINWTPSDRVFIF